MYAQEFIYANNLCGTEGDFSYKLATDETGNVYITGYYNDKIDFDPGPETHYLDTGTSQDNIFVAKYDLAGNYIWAFSIGSIGLDAGCDIAIDANSYVYLTGYFASTVDFDPGPETHNLVASVYNDFFIAKFDIDGNFIWAKSAGNPFSNDSGYCIRIDDTGSVYVAGEFSGTTDFDPGAGEYSLVSNGGFDIFFAKYDFDGNFIWAKSMGGNYNDACISMAISSVDDLFLTGSFQMTCDFDPGVDIETFISEGWEDVFVAKYDSSGNYDWAFTMGGATFDNGNSLAIDSFDNIYVTGFFDGTMDLDPSVETELVVSEGESDVFFAKYSDGGEYIWGNSFGSSAEDAGYAIATDLIGDVYLAGNFGGPCDFDLGPAESFLGSTGGLFFAKYDAEGGYCWAGSAGQSNFDVARSISLDLFGNVYISGNILDDTIDMDPSPEMNNLITCGGRDIFIAKYGDTIVSTEIHSDDSSLVQLFPNPAENNITLQGKSSKNFIAIYMFDMFGNMVLNERCSLPHTLDINYLRPGVYYCKVIDEEKTLYSTKFVKV